MLLERGDWFGHQPQSDKYVHNTFSSNPNVGEITGKKYDNSEVDKGMPMRNYEDYNKHDTTIVNPGLDFDLYDKKSDKGEISHFEAFRNRCTTFFRTIK